MSNSPLVSVILPCFNAERYLKEALDSIISQSYKNLEIICLNDGSVDNTSNILAKFATKDERIRVIENQENLKLIRTLNKGIEAAKGDYIARMDADDISEINRIELQMNFLLNHPEVDIVSGNWEFISEQGVFEKSNSLRCLTSKEIAFASHFFTPIGHALLVGKKQVFEENKYSIEKIAMHCEDFELWSRMLRNSVVMANIDEVIYKIRLNSESVSRQNEELQNSNFTICARKHFELFNGKKIDENDFKIMINRFSKVTIWEVNFVLNFMNRVRKDFPNSSRTITLFQKTDILIQFIKSTSNFQKLLGITHLVLLSFNASVNKRYYRFLKAKFK